MYTSSVVCRTPLLSVITDNSWGSGRHKLDVYQGPTVSVVTITPGLLVQIKLSVQDPTVSVITITPDVMVHIKFSVQDPTVSVITDNSWGPGTHQVYCAGPHCTCNNNNSWVMVHIKFSLQGPTVTVITITPGVLAHINLMSTSTPGVICYHR